MSTTSDTSYLFAYCERAGDAGFWGEPLNAITNLTFIIFAILCVRLMASLPEKRFRRVGDIWLLVVAMFAIGIGSGLWHTHTRPWTLLADVIPIYLFINVYLFSLFMRLGGCRFWQAALVWLVFQGLSFGAEIYLPRDTLNGSIMYIPTLLALGLASLWLWHKRASGWREIAVVLAIFTLSLTFRTIDLMVCDAFPLGTHFIWHMLNAVVLYRLVRLLVRQQARE